MSVSEWLSDDWRKLYDELMTPPEQWQENEVFKDEHRLIIRELQRRIATTSTASEGYDSLGKLIDVRDRARSFRDGQRHFRDGAKEIADMILQKLIELQAAGMPEKAAQKLRQTEQKLRQVQAGKLSEKPKSKGHRKR